MMPSIESYVGEQSRQLRIAAMQGAGIVFLGNFAGMVAGLVLSPPPSINISKTIGGSLFGGLVGIAIGEADTLRVYRTYFDFKDNQGV